jgi:hypothetical protein
MEQVQRGPVDRPGQRRGNQLLHLIDGQRTELKTLRKPILPEGDDRSGRRLAGADCGQHERLRCRGQQVRQGGGGIVEKVSVVDEDRHRLALAVPVDCPGDLPQHGQQIPARFQLRHEGGVGSEGQAGRTLGRGHAEWNEPLGSSDGQTLGGQPGLPHTCWPAKNCSSPAGPEQPGDLLELSRSAHERPRQAHGSPHD